MVWKTHLHPFLVSAEGRKLMKRICVLVSLWKLLWKPDTLFFSRQFMIYHLKTTMSGKNLTLRNFSTFFLNLSWDDTLVKEQLNHDYESWLPGWGGGLFFFGSFFFFFGSAHDLMTGMYLGNGHGRKLIDLWSTWY